MSYPYKYPEPFLQNGRKLYVFDYVAPDGSRKRRNTYRDTKKEARQEIRTSLDRLYDPNAIDDEIRRQTFKQYAAPFFVEGKCPRTQRLRGERNISGAVHNEKSRRWLDQYAMKDPFADIPVLLIKRRDILDLRERLLKKTGGEKINTINKVIDSVKTVLSEVYLREDIDRNPGYRIGKLRYDKEEPGILTPEQIRELFKNRPGHFASIQAYDLFYLPRSQGCAPPRSAPSPGQRLIRTIKPSWFIKRGKTTPAKHSDYPSGTRYGIYQRRSRFSISLPRKLHSTVLRRVISCSVTEPENTSVLPGGGRASITPWRTWGTSSERYLPKR